MKNGTKIVIIGGGACGPKAAARARRCDPTAQITLFEAGSIISYAACGLPYYISGAVSKRSSLLVRSLEQFKQIYDVEVATGARCESIDRQAHNLQVRDLQSGNTRTLEYDKLVLATGAAPVMLPLPGKELAGIYLLKEVPDADVLLSLVTEITPKRLKAVIIGAGSIGMEMTEALFDRGLDVTVVEAMDRPLPALLEPDVASVLAKYLSREGVDLRLGERVLRFEGDSGRVSRVVIGTGTLEADLVVMAVGVRPNVELARQAGLQIGATGAIAVNPNLQTSDPDIYAGGDCVENTHLISGKKVFTPLGSTANKHGRVIGTNVTGGNDVFPGIVGTALVKVFESNVGSVGLTEKQARESGFDPVTALVAGPERATYYPATHDLLIRLIADRKSGRLLGGQALGRGEIAKRIDVLATVITLGGSLDALANMDLGYAPPYNNAMDVLSVAANVLRNKLSGMAHGLSPAQVKAKLDANEDFILLDVRSQEEWKRWRLNVPQVKLVPQPSLRESLDGLRRDKEVVTMCRLGARSYQAEKLLEGEGFEKVSFMESSLTGWPYEDYGGADA